MSAVVALGTAVLGTALLGIVAPGNGFQIWEGETTFPMLDAGLLEKARSWFGWFEWFGRWRPAAARSVVRCEVVSGGTL